MKVEETNKLEQKEYEAPEILASYDKKELEESIKPHGTPDQSGGGGCGCGGGSILIP